MLVSLRALCRIEIRHTLSGLNIKFKRQILLRALCWIEIRNKRSGGYSLHFNYIVLLEPYVDCNPS
jgi:acyl-CoA thioesterase FadM